MLLCIFPVLQNPQAVLVINSIELDPFALRDQHNNLVEDRTANVNS